MSPSENVIKSFDPDTYIRHELDGKPILKLDIPVQNKPKLYIPTQDDSRVYMPIKDRPLFHYKPSSRFAIDYYGNKEYMRDDAYGYFHKSAQSHNTETDISVVSRPYYKKDWVKDQYGNWEYIGKDTYKFFNPVVSHNAELITQPTLKSQTNYYSTCQNPDYQLFDNQPNLKPGVHELQGKAISKHVCNSWQKELHFDSSQSELKGKIIAYELDADQYEDTISTSLDSTNFNTRLEFVRNFSVYTQIGVLPNISLGVKTVNNNIVFIYIKFKEIGKRKILWTIWEKDRGKYESYKQFKRVWDSNLGIISKIKKDIRNDIRFEVEDLLGIKKIKKDLKKTIRSEVEKLLRERQPFRS